MDDALNIVTAAIISEIRDQAFTRPELELDTDFGDPKFARIEGRVNIRAVAKAAIEAARYEPLG